MPQDGWYGIPQVSQLVPVLFTIHLNRNLKAKCSNKLFSQNLSNAVAPNFKALVQLKQNLQLFQVLSIHV